MNSNENERIKPDCPLIGEDGNIFNLMGIASSTLRRNGMAAEAKEMSSRIFDSGSYDEALAIISEYVNVTSVDEDMQMIERPLMTVDELKSIPKGHFVVMKTGCHPMKTRLKLFFKWGISFENAYSIPEKSAKKVQYADKSELERAILRKFPPKIQVDLFDDEHDKGSSKRQIRTARDDD